MSADRDHAIQMLGEALPQLGAERARLRDEWLPDPPPFTVLMGAMGQALGASVSSLDDDEVQRMADIVETLLCTGTDDVKNGIATGLLEALMHFSDTEPAATRLMTRLGPESKEYCRAWDGFTGGKTPGL